MVLSRFWYVLLSIALAVAFFLLYLATEVSNRSASRTRAELLTAASNAVGWYLKDDARTRATALIPLALDADVLAALGAASQADNLKEVKGELKDKARKALKKYAQSLEQRAEKQKETGGALVFDALWAIDTSGRVVANIGFEQGTSSPHFEMGGYSLVADALHGWIRDDAWVFDDKIYRVVAHPVEREVGAAPIGAIVGAKVVDDRFAEAISVSTGAAVAFYAGGTRIATGAPASFDKTDLEITAADVARLGTDENYKVKGRTAVLPLPDRAGGSVAAIFARMPGEAWDRGAGYVVGHRQPTVHSPFEFQRLADEKDKAAVPSLWIALVAAGLALLGLLLTVFEHTLPLARFRRATRDLGAGRVDVLKPATFGWSFKKIAADINDGLDKVAAAAGVDRGPADLERVLGPLPQQPTMSAFAVPEGDGAGLGRLPALPDQFEPLAERKRKLPSLPGEAEVPAKAPAAEAAARKTPAPPQKAAAAVAPAPGPAAPAADPRLDPATEGEFDEEAYWQQVFQEFVALKGRLGEGTKKLAYDKFRQTLQRNKDELAKQHGCTRVKFRVYEKNGKAALKASPVK
ncbi:MAG: hypothetical protein HY744_16475 [Deltaproteobacteria bacterium]|nr:hypothetical protein [Deltaproteobacteria bacterium]